MGLSYSMAEALRTETAFPFITTIRDASGFVAGNTMEQSVFDPATNQWLNMTTGAWQGTKSTAAKTEVQTGVFRRTATFANTPPTSPVLIGFGEVTAGPAIGAIDVEPVWLRDVIEPSTPVDISTQVAADLAAAHGAGNWESAGGLSEQSIWEYVLSDNASNEVAGSAAEALFGAGGGFSPTQVAESILESLLEPYKDQDGTVGQALYSVDGTSLKALLMAAIGQLFRYGAAFKRFPCVELFVGESVPVLAPILQAGELADLTGATIVWNFTNAATGAEVDGLVGTISGTPGHAEYNTTPGDGVSDAAATWRAQAVATLADSTVVPSPIMVVKVKAVL